MPDAAYPQGSQPVAPPTGWIRLTLQGNSLTSTVVSPRVRLNGYPVVAQYGENLYPVPPGAWRVDVHCQWLREYGQAALDLQVPVDEVVPVFYAPPLHQFAAGRIGFERQRRQGALGLALVVALVAALVVTMAVALAVVAAAILLTVT